MTLSLETPEDSPPRILIYGPEGVGKTTFGKNSPNPVFLQTEKGLIGTSKRYPVSKTYKEIMDNLAELATKNHDRQTIIIDSVDWLEPLIWQQVCKESNAKTIEDVGGGYGKGYASAIDLWREYLSALDYLNEQKKMTIIQIAHAQVKRYENPETEAYDRYGIKLQDGKNISAAALLLEYSDIVIFANYFVGVSKEEKVFNKQRKRAIGSGERILYTQERPAFKAKTRYELPEEIPFDKEGNHWGIIANAIPFFNNQTHKEKNNG